MDWLLAALAIFNLVSMATVFSPRSVPRRSVPWALFGTALLATELAWIWLPLQLLLAWVLVGAGALESGLGIIALLVLLGTWPGLVWSIWMSTKAESSRRGCAAGGTGSQLPQPDTTRPQPPAAQPGQCRRTGGGHWPCRAPGWSLSNTFPTAPPGCASNSISTVRAILPAEGCPVLLQIHGGAWMMGDKGSQAQPLMYHLASKGWICVAANYRLSPSVGFPTHLEDCKRALCWVREHGREYGMNPDFVAVTGGSAGGHLTALMGLTANRPEFQQENPEVDTSVQACIPFYGVYDFLVRYDQHPNRRVYERFLTGKVLHESVKDNPALWDLASPVAQIHPDAPPFMIFHGTHDSLAAVTEGRVFSKKLREVSQQPVVYVEMPGAEHAWEIVHSLRTEHTIDGVHRFLEWARAGVSNAPAG